MAGVMSGSARAWRRSTLLVALSGVGLAAALMPAGAFARPPLYAPFPSGTQGYISQGQGQGGHADAYQRYALDLRPDAGEGAQLVAPADGYIAYRRGDHCARGDAGCEYGLGLWVGIKFEDGTDDCFVAAHLKPGSVLVGEGARIRRGEPFAQVGMTGHTTGPHAHVTVAGPDCGYSFGRPWQFADIGAPLAGARWISGNPGSAGAAAPRRRTTSDVNGDGRDDLLWFETNPAGGYDMSVIGGNADGTFSGFHTRRRDIGPPLWAGVGDVNGDGRDDLLWFESNPAGGHDLSVVGGRADGTLSAFHTRRSDVGPPLWAGVGDVNGDGRDDLVWFESNPAGGHDLSVIGGSPDGSLSLFHTRRSDIGPPLWAGVGDINGDHRDDLLWFESSPAGGYDMSVIGGTQEGSLTLFHTRRPLGPPLWGGVGDVNGDGRDDLLWLEPSPGGGHDMSVVGGSADGTLSLFHTRRPLGPPLWGGVGDVNGDGRDDAWWLEQRPTGGYDLSVIGGSADGSLSLFHTRRGDLAPPLWGGRGSFPGTNGAGWRQPPGGRAASTSFAAPNAAEPARQPLAALMTCNLAPQTPAGN